MSGSSFTMKPARSSARTPRDSHPNFGAYEGETTPMVSPFTIAGGRSSGGRVVTVGDGSTSLTAATCAA